MLTSSLEFTPEDDAIEDTPSSRTDDDA